MKRTTNLVLLLLWHVAVAYGSTISGPGTVCVGNNISLSIDTSGGIWSSSTPASATINSATGVLTGLADGTTTVSYMIGADLITTQDITVNPLPDVITGPSSVCMGSVVTLVSSPGGGVWTSSNTVKATVDAGTGEVTGRTPGTSNISYTSPAGCVRSTSILVNLIPTAIAGNTSMCEGGFTALSTGSPGGTWSSSEPGVATVSTTGGVVRGIDATAAAGGVTTITYQLSTGCTSTLAVTVNATPGTIRGTLSACIGTTTTLSASPGGGAWTSSTPARATIDASGVVSGIAAGTSVITYTSGSCFKTTIVTVQTLPSALSGTASVCEGANTQLTSSPGGGAWTSSNTTAATVNPATGIVTGLAAGNSTISYQPASGCIRTREVTVNVAPSAITGTTSVCIGSTTTLNATPGGGVWSSSIPTRASINSGTGVVTGLSAGNTTITYNAGGCFVTQVVAVSALPSAITGTLSFCSGSSVTLSSSPSGGVWSSGAVLVATVNSGSGLVTGVGTGNAAITYTTGAGCTRTTNVTVDASISANTGTPTICLSQPSSVSILSNATPGGTWSSSNAARLPISPSGVMKGKTLGTANVTYTTGSGCFSVTEVTVNAAVANITGATAICPGVVTTLDNITGGGTWISSNTARATIDELTGDVTGISAGTVTITYLVSDGCYKTVTQTVSSPPASISGLVSVCENATTLLTCSPSGGTWSSSNLSAATVSTTGIVTGIAAGTANITYQAGTGCSAVREVTINALPTAISGTASICPGAVSALTSTPGGGVWSSSIPARASVDAGTGEVTGVSSGTTTMSYTKDGCGVSQVVTVSTGASVITGTAIVCIGGTTTLASSPAGGVWTSTNASAATVDAATGEVTGIGTGVSTISYESGAGCIASREVTVTGAPADITGTMALCAGSITTLASSPAGGVWSSSMNARATVAASGDVTAVSAGTVTITYSLGSGCIKTAEITVNPTPSSLTGTATLCAGVTTTLSSSPLGGTWSSGSTGIATVNAGVVTGISSGQAAITYDMGAGCIATLTVTVSGSASGISGTATACVGSTTSLNATPGGGVWSSSAPAKATVNSGTGEVTGIAAGTTTVSYAEGGCTATITVTVNAIPSAIAGNLSLCSGNATTLTSSPSGGTWSSSNTAAATVNATTGVVQGIAAGSAQIEYTSAAGCVQATTVTVTTGLPDNTGYALICLSQTTSVQLLSNSVPGGTWSSSNPAIVPASPSGYVRGMSIGTANLTYTLGGCSAITEVTVNGAVADITGTANVCPGASVTLENVTASGTWISSNTATATVNPATGEVTGIAGGTAVITYKVSGGCYKAALQTVLTGPNSISGTLSTCAGGTTSLAGSPGGGTWTSGTTSIAAVGSSTGIVAGVAEGTSVITYTYVTGCAKTTTVTITTGSNAGTITGASSVAVGGTTNLTNAIGGGTWSSSNTAFATVGTTGIVTGVSEGSLTISYTLDGICGTATATKAMTVTTSTVPEITGTFTVCPTGNTTLANTEPGGTWSSATPAVASVNAGSGIVTGLTAGTTVISYTVPGGTVTAVITVNPTPNAGTITGGSTVTVGATLSLSNGAGGGAWSSSNVSIATVGSTGVVTGIAPGAATISYSVTNACGTVHATKAVTVNPIPAITGTLTVCPTGTTQLANTESGGVWSSETPGIASVNAGTGLVAGISNGTTVISYTLPGGTVTAIVTVNPAPDAGTITGGTTVTVGATLALSNATGSGVWSSSNVTYATVNGTGGVTGLAEGALTISYEVTNGCGTATATKAVTITAIPAITGTLAICPTGTTLLDNIEEGGAWSSATPSVASVNAGSGMVTGLIAGTTVISYTLPGGTVTAVVTVNPLPDAGSISGASDVATNGTISLTDAAGGGVWSSTNTSFATVSAGGVVTGIADGSLTISYTVTNSCGTAAATKALSVITIPAITGTTTVCVAASTLLDNSETGGVWTSSTPGAATVSTGVGMVAGIAAGTTTISYTIYGGIVTTVVSVIPFPNAGTIMGASAVGEGLDITLTNAAAGGTWSSSNPAFATISSTGVVTGIAEGTLTISYEVTNSCGTATATKAITVTAAGAASTGCPAWTDVIGGLMFHNELRKESMATTMAPDGTLYMAFMNGIHVFVTRHTSSGWHLYPGKPRSLYPGNSGTAIGIGSTGHPHIGIISDFFEYITTVYEFTGDPYYSPGEGFSLNDRYAVDNDRVLFATSPAGRLFVATFDVNYGISVKRQNSGWEDVNTAGIVGGSLTYSNPSIAIGTDENPYLSYISTGATSKVSVKHYNGSTWDLVGAADFTAAGIGRQRLGVDNSGTPYVAYSDAAQLVSVMKFDGAAWVAVGSSGIGHSVGDMLALSIDPSGVPYVACLESAVSTKVIVKKFDGADWVLAGGVPVSDAPVSTSYFNKISLSIGADAAPVVSYLDNDSAGQFNTTVVRKLSAPEIIGSRFVICPVAGVNLTTSLPGGVWSSNNPSVAAVSDIGNVLGISPGTAVITYAVGTCYNTAVFTVNPFADAGEVSGPVSVETGNTVLLSATGSGGNWVSSAPGIASVNASGLVTGIVAGTANISYAVTSVCSSAGDDIATQVVHVVTTAGDPITGIMSFCQGSSSALANGTPTGTWSSNNTSVATIDATTGIVSGIAAGTAVISYSVPPAMSVTIVTVNPVPDVATISGPTTVSVGLTTGLGSNLSGGVWSSSDDGIAEVGPNGNVLGVAAGDAMITYTITNACGDGIATANVTVITYAADCAPSWKSVGPLAFSDNNAEESNIAIDGSNVPYVIYKDDANEGKATVKRFIGGAWETVGNAGFSTSPIFQPYIFLDSVGAPTVIFAVWETYGLYFYTYKLLANIWREAGDRMNVGGYSHLAAAQGPNGHLYVYYSAFAYEFTYGEAAIHSNIVEEFDGYCWTRIADPNSNDPAKHIGGDMGDFLDITVSPSGTPYVVYEYGGSYVFKYNGVAWSQVGTSFASSEVGGSMLTTDNTGMPYIAYWEWSNSKINVKKYNGTTWEFVGPATFSTGTIKCPNIAFDANNDAFVAYQDMTLNKLIVKKFDGSVWNEVGTLDFSSYTSTDGTLLNILHLSLAFDEGGVPFVTYSDNANARKLSVQKFDGGLSNITGTRTVAEGATTNLYNTTPGGAWSSGTPAVATVDASGEVTGILAGTTVITYALDECTTTAIVSVTASAKPGHGNSVAITAAFTVFPNPTSGSLTIRSGVSGALVLFTIDGRQVLEQTIIDGDNTLVLPANLATGIYMFRFKGADGSTKMGRLVYEP